MASAPRYSLAVPALFHNPIWPRSILHKILREEISLDRETEVANEVGMKTKKFLDKIKTTPFEDLPSLNKALGWIKMDLSHTRE